MPATTRDLFRSYVRSLRWQVPLALVVVTALWAYDYEGLRRVHGFGYALLLGLGFLFVVGPLVWLRFEHYGRNDRPFWIFLGLSLVWMAISLLVLLFVLALVIGD
ncbi:hypothetical protein [Nocardioides zhouii]|uniref:Uncharacterized protein n=1 Tax=Nocardioides zhouii TaxID=1168729 RepID=A0A4V1RQM3_9ACTN|nr:hypothetical protein [Nocardioides zhouii]RYC13357.1 hypothetical protein EUA94_05680 [Nocardioides zhouii]